MAIYSLRACPPADLVEHHASPLADVVDEREQVADAEAVDDIGCVHPRRPPAR